MALRLRHAVAAAVPVVGLSGAIAFAAALVLIVVVVAVLAFTGHPPQITWGTFKLRWPASPHRRRRRR